MSAAGTSDFTIRTEDLKDEKVLELFVPTKRDNALVELLKTFTPIIIEGSRGAGKSFLLKVCEQTQLHEFPEARVLPVYVSFIKSSLLASPTPQQFHHWMIARLCSSILRAIQRQGLSVKPSAALKILSGGSTSIAEATGSSMTKLEQLAEAFENSFKTNKIAQENTEIPTVEKFRDAIQDLCEDLKIERFNILFDEVAHIFKPEQQRQFFTLFRDLRSPHMTCNAAVYPGVTAYGSVFETSHDARIEALNRDPMLPDYLTHMRELVFKQASSEQQRAIETNGNLFDTLAYAVTGNPRILLKTFALVGRLNSSNVETVIKNYYRNAIWAEHSALAERYPGHKELIDWGRRFVENTVIPAIIKRNNKLSETGNLRTSMLWVHKDAPAVVYEALRLLTYTGILTLVDQGVKGTRSQIGTRYLLNIGCLAASAHHTVPFMTELRKGITIKQFTEFGAKHSSFESIAKLIKGFPDSDDDSRSLSAVLLKPINLLDLSEHQRQALNSIQIPTIGDALNATEETFQKARYIGPVRSRRIMNIVTAAVLEYLSG